MSRTLGRLRETTGDSLLVRAGRNMVLTPYAEAIRERTHQVVTEARAVLSPSSEELDLTTLDRTFSLRANDGFVEAFGAALIAAAVKEAPRVRLRFEAKSEKSDRPLREGLVDLEIGVLGGMGPEIRLQALFRDRFVGVVRKGHAIEKLREMTPEFYAVCDHVVATRSGKGSGPVDEALADLGLQRNIAAVVSSFHSALVVARESDLVALVPASFLSHQPGRGETSGFYVFELPVKTASITVSQIWHPRSENDPAHRWLRQLVRKTLMNRGAAA